jgi:hypothetical protein
MYCKAISLSFSLPTDRVYDLIKYIYRNKYKLLICNTWLKGAFHRSFTLLVRYRFPLHTKTNYKYLAFDVSLPPPKNLSCSPKQLDSVYWLIVYKIYFLQVQT